MNDFSALLKDTDVTTKEGLQEFHNQNSAFSKHLEMVNVKKEMSAYFEKLVTMQTGADDLIKAWKAYKEANNV